MLHVRLLHVRSPKRSRMRRTDTQKSRSRQAAKKKHATCQEKHSGMQGLQGRMLRTFLSRARARARMRILQSASAGTCACTATWVWMSHCTLREHIL
jgi:hypothetical protein